MFSSDNKKQTTEFGSQQNIIAAGTEIVGDIISNGAFRIDGKVEGNIKTSGKIVVGKTGVIKGNIEGKDASFEGNLSGKLVLSGTLSIKSSAHIEGEIQVSKLAVEPGATVNASCSMKGAVKSLNDKSSSRKQLSAEEKQA